MAPHKSVFQCGSCVVLKVSHKAVSEVPGGGPNIQISEKLDYNDYEHLQNGKKCHEIAKGLAAKQLVEILLKAMVLPLTVEFPCSAL